MSQVDNNHLGDDVQDSRAETDAPLNTPDTDEITEAPSGEAVSSEADVTEVIDEAAHVAKLEQQLKEENDKYLRLYAELENFRRRTRLDMEAAQKYRVQSLVTAILPALDNFERAMKVEAVSDESIAIFQGMEMIYNQLQTALVAEGVEIIKATGEQFDPNFHQAVMQAEEEGFASNEIVEEFQKGYLLKDRVIRPSMVKVNQ